MNPTEIRDAVAERVDAEALPPMDLGRVVARGHRLRRRRRAAAGVTVLAAGAMVAGVLTLTDGADRPGDDTAFDPVGRLDLSGGMRAFASPDGGELHLGGRRFTDRNLPFLDTDAVATGAGLVFFRGEEVLLLDETGAITRIDRTGAEVSEEFRPTAKSDSTAPRVAYGVRSEGGMTVVVYDLVAREPVARHEFTCDDCSQVVVDAFDDGSVFVRTEDGTQLWEVGTDTVTRFASGETRIADVRNGVVLHDGPAPDPAVATRRWLFVKGPIDALLTFDGGHVLDWSSRLRPTRPGGEPIVLEQPKPGDGYAFWNVDTDGSIMVAVPRGNGADVFDCAVPAGSCVPVGEVSTDSGDPVFIGNDM